MTVCHEKGGDSIECQDAEVKGAGDWPRDREEEGDDWPRERVCHTHERAIPIQETVEALDITEEGKRKLMGEGWPSLKTNSLAVLLELHVSVFQV